MSPKLSDEEPKEGSAHKFVRDGEEVAWGSWRTEHADIGLTNGVGEPIGLSAAVLERLLVDDAGWFELMRGGVYEISSNSGSCKRRGDKSAMDARNETLDVFKRTTGKEARRG